ncbi:serine/threonine protein kinase [Oceanobacillus massiliensis]|nr:protein kinase [Oceanobacillus massiliensis]
MKFLLDRYYKDGQLLNARYEIIKTVGAGSFGLIYLCRDIENNEMKIAKQLRKSKRLKKGGLELFENEISILGQLNHSNLPTLYDHFSTKKNHFYVMDYIEAENLDEKIFIHNQMFNEKTALSLFSDLLQVIDYLHSQRIYHLDLRIPNIILKESEPYVIDFGLAKNMAGNEQDQQHVEEAMRQQDYYDLGDILLFLLYTEFDSDSKKALPWTEELTLKKETTHLLKRLLGIETAYTSAAEITADLNRALQLYKRT